MAGDRDAVDRGYPHGLSAGAGGDIGGDGRRRAGGARQPRHRGIQTRYGQVLEHRQHALVHPAGLNGLASAPAEGDAAVVEHLGLELLL